MCCYPTLFRSLSFFYINFIDIGLLAMTAWPVWCDSWSLCKVALKTVVVLLFTLVLAVLVSVAGWLTLPNFLIPFTIWRCLLGCIVTGVVSTFSRLPTNYPHMYGWLQGSCRYSQFFAYRPAVALSMSKRLMRMVWCGDCLNWLSASGAETDFDHCHLAN